MRGIEQNSHIYSRMIRLKSLLEDTSGIVAYHGTGAKFSRFALKYSTQGIIWFTSNKQSIVNKEVGANSHGYVITARLNIKKPAGWNEYHKYSIGELKGLGYDGIILDSSENSDLDYVVFHPNQVKILKTVKV